MGMHERAAFEILPRRIGIVMREKELYEMRNIRDQMLGHLIDYRCYWNSRSETRVLTDEPR
jgi:hypothetical protein